MRHAAALALFLGAASAWAGPETSQREFASSQVKKGVRSLGMGGNGATLGNYALAGEGDGAFLTTGSTHFTDTRNDFRFVALGANFAGPVGVSVIAISEWGSGLRLRMKSAAFPGGAPFVAEGADQALFVKVSHALGAGFSVGALVGYEHAQLSGAAPEGALTYTTAYRPSGGLGVLWQHGRDFMAGVRVVGTHDLEKRTDRAGADTGMNASWEFRAGVAAMPWPGGTVDAGWIGANRRSGLEHTESFDQHLVAGVEQAFGDRFAVRAGWNETSPTAGASVRAGRFKLDVAYVRDLGVDRTRGVFGNGANSVLATLGYTHPR